MRCPKCATSFMVERPASLDEKPREVPTTSKNGPLLRVGRPSSPLKQTMIGIAGPAGPFGGGLPARPPTRQAMATHGLAADPAARVPTERPAPSAQSDANQLPAIAIRDLPASTSGKVPGPGLPQVARPKPPPPVRAAVAAPAASAALDSELPAALGSRPKSPPKPAKAPEQDRLLSATAVESSPSIKADEGELELPELAKEPPLVTPVSLGSRSVDSDLPVQPSNQRDLGHRFRGSLKSISKKRPRKDCSEHQKRRPHLGTSSRLTCRHQSATLANYAVSHQLIADSTWICQHRRTCQSPWANDVTCHQSNPFEGCPLPAVVPLHRIP